MACIVWLPRSNLPPTAAKVMWSQLLGYLSVCPCVFLLATWHIPTGLPYDIKRPVKRILFRKKISSSHIKYLILLITIHHKVVYDWLQIVEFVPDSKVHGANMGHIWVLSAKDGPHVGPKNLVIRGAFRRTKAGHGHRLFPRIMPMVLVLLWFAVVCYWRICKDLLR